MAKLFLCLLLFPCVEFCDEESSLKSYQFLREERQDSVPTPALPDAQGGRKMAPLRSSLPQKRVFVARICANICANICSAFYGTLNCHV